MISFTTALVCLILGYLIYGSIVERVFGPNRQASMPCYEKQDGVDYLPMKPWRVFLVQFLNIAGTGPIFGAIMGILFGPAAYLWIVLGCIFAGSVHDYLGGMICVRKGGVSLPEIVGDELGKGMRLFIRVFSPVLLVLAGTVFVTTPAALLQNMAPLGETQWIWVAIIFVYYIVATLLPIDKLIGQVYPIFGCALLIMAAGLLFHIYYSAGSVPEITDAPFVSHHPKGLPIFPMLCITIACGAISGFHGTQSPLMARCLTNEKYGRPIFYGAMISEGIVALVWAAAAVKFADSLPGEGTCYEKLAAMGGPSVVVSTICSTWMGKVGAILAVLGVVAAPITSGDTCFRSARLIAADIFGVSQKAFWRRLLLCLPLFLISTALLFLDFNVLWRYFAWTNQSLACITLWAVTVWLCKHDKAYVISLVPAIFMTCVCTAYILVADEGFQIPLTIGLSVGIVAAVVAAAGFFVWKCNRKKSSC